MEKNLKYNIHEYFIFLLKISSLKKRFVENFNISTNNLISVEVPKEGTSVLYCSSIAGVG